MLQTAIELHQENGNPGRFKLLSTAQGLVIAPNAVRNSAGVFVSDRSLLEARISFPELDADGDIALNAFAKALAVATGIKVKLPTSLFNHSVRISASNEVARDVLARLLASLHRTFGIGGGGQAAKFAWDLTLEPAIDLRHADSFSLALRAVLLEYRDAKGNLLGSRPVPQPAR